MKIPLGRIINHLFNRAMVYLTVLSLARFLGYTPDEVIEMYDRANKGLPTFDD